ncbi:cysteine ABC transporter permease [Novosphingobium fuchskuhlense]|uniref:Cysteine ABC transporter permease n=1 Tax=Novosphingobium fuchskuhlense TaxID=1117702 RepID=A0A124JU62_9SPHN|nr:ATP-binding cassette domain-containing protein [Novosphingobium fuchskuhlense]KUR70895.1 cysteine ABC transporter permease [Novosphingobium fuchskuhlense]
MRIYKAAGFAWTSDIAGAAIFAWGLASALEARLAGGTMAVMASGCALMMLGGLLRLASQVGAQVLGFDEGRLLAQARRAELFPRLLALAGPSGPALGATATLGIDHIAAEQARAARFDPVRQSATSAPLLVAAIVALQSWVAALILLATLIPFVIGMIFAGGAARQAADRQMAAITALSALYVDRIRHLPIIRHFAAEDRIARAAGRAAQDVAARTIAVLRAAFISSAVLEFFAALSVALVAVYCGFSLLGLLPFPAIEVLNYRSALFVLVLAPEFYLPMRRLAAAYHEKQLGEAAEKALADLPQPSQRPARAASVLLRGVIVEWPGHRIGPVSLELGAQGLVCITGPTGSGKTSLLAAIAGQVAPSKGAIATLPAEAIAWAGQVPLLLPTTLGDNLRLGKPEADDAAVTVAVSAVGLDALVARRAEGLNTAIDHHGAWLSGGERRRLGLARALIADRALLLADEPTADLDSASAERIIALLTSEARQRAIIVATHDERLVAAADTVIAL